MSNISSTNPTYLSALRGDTVGSVQSLLTQIRGLMGEVDQQVNGLQAELKGVMEATGHERNRLNFLRSLAADIPTGSNLRAGRDGFQIAARMRENGIDPANNSEDRTMCAELGIYVMLTTDSGQATRVGFTNGNLASQRTRESLNSMISNHQSTLETYTNSMSQDSTRLQALMNRRGEFMSTISQCINSDHTTSNSIIQNIR